MARWPDSSAELLSPGHCKGLALPPVGREFLVFTFVLLLFGSKVLSLAQCCKPLQLLISHRLLYEPGPQETRLPCNCVLCWPIHGRNFSSILYFSQSLACLKLLWYRGLLLFGHVAIVFLGCGGREGWEWGTGQSGCSCACNPSQQHVPRRFLHTLQLDQKSVREVKLFKFWIFFLLLHLKGLN